jgi:hypothetical protein
MTQVADEKDDVTKVFPSGVAREVAEMFFAGLMPIAEAEHPTLHARSSETAALLRKLPANFLHEIVQTIADLLDARRAEVRAAKAEACPASVPASTPVSLGAAAAMVGVLVRRLEALGGRAASPEELRTLACHHRAAPVSLFSEGSEELAKALEKIADDREHPPPQAQPEPEAASAPAESAGDELVASLKEVLEAREREREEEKKLALGEATKELLESVMKDAGAVSWHEIDDGVQAGVADEKGVLLLLPRAPKCGAWTFAVLNRGQVETLHALVAGAAPATSRKAKKARATAPKAKRASAPPRKSAPRKSAPRKSARRQARA